jgi:hypothetical protein
MSDNDYPDSPPATLGDLKSIKRIPGIRSNPPRISWGSEYLAWPVERRLRYAENLACSMNHAADVLQTSRNKVIEVCQQQQEMIQQLNSKLSAQGKLLHEEMVRADARYQELAVQLVATQDEVRHLKKELKNYQD